jgi:hypothetical protein
MPWRCNYSVMACLPKLQTVRPPVPASMGQARTHGSSRRLFRCSALQICIPHVTRHACEYNLHNGHVQMSNECCTIAPVQARSSLVSRVSTGQARRRFSGLTVEYLTRLGTITHHRKRCCIDCMRESLEHIRARRAAHTHTVRLPSRALSPSLLLFFFPALCPCLCYYP